MTLSSNERVVAIIYQSSNVAIIFHRNMYYEESLFNVHLTDLPSMEIMQMISLDIPSVNII